MHWFHGWKAIVDYIGRHERTVKRYHYQILRIPFRSERAALFSKEK